MDLVKLIFSHILSFVVMTIFFVGLLSVCNYQIQIVQGQGMQLVNASVADERYRD
jgi:hypothetical protein